MLAPVMPYNDFASLTKEAALAIAAYLKSLPALGNKMPGPFGPADKPDVFVMTVLPAPVYNGLLPPPGK
jgi:hypothetical protein